MTFQGLQKLLGRSDDDYVSLGVLGSLGSAALRMSFLDSVAPGLTEYLRDYTSRKETSALRETVARRTTRHHEDLRYQFKTRFTRLQQEVPYFVGTLDEHLQHYYQQAQDAVPEFLASLDYMLDADVTTLYDSFERSSDSLMNLGSQPSWDGYFVAVAEFLHMSDLVGKDGSLNSTALRSLDDLTSPEIERPLAQWYVDQETSEFQPEVEKSA